MPPSPAPPPAPVPAWLVRAGSEEVVGGTMSLEGDHLVLRGDREEKARVDLAGVRRVRRSRGSPVLVLTTDAGVVLLYFTEPPTLSPGAKSPRPRGWERLRGDAGLKGTTGMLRLREAGRALRPVVEEWERAIRAQAGSTATNFRPREE